MCNPALMTVASGAATAYGNYQSGQGALNAGKFQGMQDRYAAQVSLQDAQDQAQIIRRAGARAVGAADASYAASGIKVGDGSSADVEREIYQRNEHDASMAILSGSRRARGLEVSAVGAEAGGRTQAANANAAAVSTLLSSGYQAQRSWSKGGSGIVIGGNGLNSGGFNTGGNGLSNTGGANSGSPTGVDWWLKYNKGGG